MPARERTALAVGGALLLITGLWWALALWPSADSAEWLARAREVCFGASDSGLPDAAGWLALILQPTIMFGALFVLWGDALEAAVTRLAGTARGKTALGGLVVLLGVSMTAVGQRVIAAAPTGPETAGPPASDARSASRLERGEPPPLDLVDQNGETISLGRFHGRPVFVTFAFGHCETVCPLVVHDILSACDRLIDLDPAVLVVTLDPWRDVPSRLAHIAGQWRLDGRGHVLSGSVDQVERVLDAWRVDRARDLATGDVIHPRLIYMIDREGRVAHATSATTEQLIALARRL